VVELDGGQHATQAASDSRRTELLRKHGYRVLRFWDNDVLRETAAVLIRISEAVNPHPNPLPGSERG
jgi:very-short-patch-repair endonuclease